MEEAEGLHREHVEAGAAVVTSLVLVCSRLALHVCIMFNFSNELEMGTDQTLAPDQIK